MSERRRGLSPFTNLHGIASRACLPSPNPTTLPDLTKVNVLPRLEGFWKGLERVPHGMLLTKSECGISELALCPASHRHKLARSVCGSKVLPPIQHILDGAQRPAAVMRQADRLKARLNWPLYGAACGCGAHLNMACAFRWASRKCGGENSGFKCIYQCPYMVPISCYMAGRIY